MAIKVKVDKVLFEWKDGKLQSNDDELLEHFKFMLEMHIPTVVAMPDLVDYYNDLTDERNMFLALKGIFEECEVIESPASKILEYDTDYDRIY